MTLKYAQLKADLIEDSSVTTIFGVPIEYEGGEGRASGGLSVGLNDAKFIPIWGFCLCVQDSPDNPCPCHGPITWLPRDKIFRTGKTGRKDADGNEILWFKLDHNTKIVIDAQIPSTAALYEEAIRKFGEDVPTTIFSAPSPVPHPITLAFYAIMVLNNLDYQSLDEVICSRWPDHRLCKK